ncbi:MAG: GNAT family N-acetyltransferase [Treponema sp.]|nr:GNAT family N-acetyltransferase [Treponema sp.]
MPVIIKPLLADRREEALSFIQPYESECVNLASEILRGSADCWCIFYAERLQDQEGAAADQEASQAETLAGLIALRKKRSLFFCLPFAKYKSAFDKKVCNEAQRPLAEFFEANEPFCVNGESIGALYLKNILRHKKTPMQSSVVNKYYLMARDAMSFPRSDAGIFQNQKIAGSSPAMTNCGLRVAQATAADYDSLLPLELGYQREEVVPKSFDISDAALAAAFKHELGQGLTFALFDGERPIAKARLAASGQRYCMIGGVYTISSERKKGRAAFLVSQIIKRSQAHGINSFSLYAKQENAAALALYKKLGFTPRGEYLLVYY